MTAPSLQDGIDRAGSPLRLLWKPGAAPWTPEVVEREYLGWRQEQAAWHDGVAISDLSHHMYDMVIEGPDATRLLAAVSANNYETFAIGQAKQIIPVTAEGYIVTDGILLRRAEQRYTLSGIPASQHWVRYHGEQGGYDVTFATDPSSAFRGGGDPKLFRYQIQGPLARQLVERAFGGPLPATRFFHSTAVTLGGRSFRALRHGMAGQPGYEFVGDWADGAYVKEMLMRAGEPFGLVHVGALAYTTASVESGWIPSPTPAIYTDPDLLGYRRWLPLFGIEGQRPLHGSFYSDDIEDYYVTPYELGYGRLIRLDRDFIGRDALEKAKDAVRWAKVTLVFDNDDVRAVLGDEPGFVLSYARHRVEAGSALVGTTYHIASSHPYGSIIALSLVDRAHAAPGTRVEVVWGEHPGAGTLADADLGFPRIRATVQPAPYNEHARTRYRHNDQ
ncbi:aminomethyl transferase family protein [Pseudofrankia sp. BMG5.37]|uniref:aminomethyl transferase family protein n=1 Tax=Pseudofrankia sp. BMG5.37 TaxID=3050035 RepID=UPI0028944A94|nr:aminomethyl transferase family protein [Pseudofrankia sp. BMG5.37]MDT3442809.1 aminomethyl transferase family protein [Pseudofrankia sp. BMG5.37]